MHFPLLRLITLLLQQSSADSNTAIVLLISELALHRADGAEPWCCLQQLCLFKTLHWRPGGGGIPPLVLLGLLREQRAYAMGFGLQQLWAEKVPMPASGHGGHLKSESAPLKLQRDATENLILLKKKRKKTTKTHGWCPWNTAPNRV